MNSKKFPVREISFLSIGELVVAVIISLIYLAMNKFDYTVVLGAVLGGGITVLNFLFLSISVNKAVDNLMSNADFPKKDLQNDEKKPDLKENEESEANAQEDSKSDEDKGDEKPDEISKFAQENTPKLQNALRLSFILRTVSMVAVLIVAAVSKQFNLLSTVIPLLMFRPLLSLSEMTKRKEK